MQGDANTCSGVGYGVVHQVTEDRVEQGVVALYLYFGLQRIDYANVFLLQLQGNFIHHVGYKQADINPFHLYHVGSLVHTGQRRDVA